MKTGPFRYHFGQPAQWRAGLLLRGEHEATGGIAPPALWAGPPQAWPATADGAGIVHAANPALGPQDTAYWIDRAAGLARYEKGDQRPRLLAAPATLAAATRVAAGPATLWAGDGGRQLRAWLRDSLAARISVELPVARILDIAANGRDGVWVLAKEPGPGDPAHVVIEVDCAGQIVRRAGVPQQICAPQALGFLARTGRIVLLARNGTRLYWLALDATDVASVFLSVDYNHGSACTSGQILATDGLSRVAVAGVDRAPLREPGASGAWVITLDDEGEALGRMPLPRAPNGLALARHALLITTGDAALLYRRARADAPAVLESSMLFVSPALHSPPAPGRHPWLRVEAQAALPPGTAIEFRHATTADGRLRDEIEALAQSGARTNAQRWALIQDKLRWSGPRRFSAGAANGADEDPQRAALYAAPLHDLREPWCWVTVSLVAAPGAALPCLQSLDVIYPDESLMHQLPAIYRRQAEAPGDFLRGLVGVLEATTQDLDARIRAIAGLLDPARTGDAWLDAIARWLGLPWDDSLPREVKRCLLRRAQPLLAQRGTRAGLQALLECVLPAGRFRILDLMVQHGLARLGGCLVGDAGRRRCCGSRLPALLSGLPAAAPVLGRGAQLGGARLPCSDRAPDVAARFAGVVLVEVVADTHERTRWAPWLRTLVDAISPLTARIRLSWIDPVTAREPAVLHDELRLEDDPAATLGSGALLGQARLARDRPHGLARGGVEPGFRLH